MTYENACLMMYEHCKRMKGIGICKGNDCEICYIPTAQQAIELQIPKRPNWQGDEKCMDAYCPNCGEALDDFDKVCECCYQRIDWSDEEA